MNVVLIVTAACLDKANALAETMGWGPNSYSVPLSADGSAPATHWGLNQAEASVEFQAMLASAAEGKIPEGLIAAGYPAEDFADVMSSLAPPIFGVAFDKRTSDLGLMAVEASEIINRGPEQ